MVEQYSIGNALSGTCVRIFGAHDEVVEMASEYRRYIFLEAFFALASLMLNNLLRAEGSARITMFCMMVGAVANTTPKEFEKTIQDTLTEYFKIHPDKHKAKTVALER